MVNTIIVIPIPNHIFLPLVTEIPLLKSKPLSAAKIQNVCYENDLYGLG